MKKLIFTILAAVALLCFSSCFTDDTASVPENSTDENVTENITENESENNTYTGEKVDVNSGNIEKEPEKPEIVSYTNSNGNLANNGMVLHCGEYLYYDAFIEDPEDEYTGGAHSIFKVKSDFSAPAEELVNMYFQSIDMCMYGEKLYFSSGGGGGRHLYEVDTVTGEQKTLHDNLPDYMNIFIDSLYLYNGFLYFECNGSIYRMKPDQTEFEVLLDKPEGQGVWLMGVEDGKVFYRDDMNRTIHRMDENGDNVIIDNFIGDYFNIYGNRIYYLNEIVSDSENGEKISAEIVSCDFDGLEPRTILQLGSGEHCRSINVTDGYVYYSVMLDDGTHKLCEYNLNGGENRVLSTGDAFYQLTLIGRKLYYMTNSYGLVGLCELDLDTLAVRTID